MNNNENLSQKIGSIARVTTGGRVFTGVIARDRVRGVLVVRNHFGSITLGYMSTADGFTPTTHPDTLIEVSQ